MGLFDSIGNVLSTALTNRSNKKLTRETNQFNAQQAELNRQFQSQEAQIARDWQESQYNKYSSPEAMVRQYQDAGLNPALMYGQNLQSSTGSSPAPSGSQAQGTAIPMQSPSFSGIIDDIVALSKVKAEIDNINADTASKRASADKLLSDVKLNELTGDEISNRINLISAQTANEKERKGLIALQKVTQDYTNQTLSYDVLKKKWEKEYYDIYGSYPGSTLWDTVRNAIELGRLGAVSGFKWLNNFLISPPKNFNPFSTRR